MLLHISLEHELSMYFITSFVVFLAINFSKIIHHSKQSREAIYDIIGKLVKEDS